MEEFWFQLKIFSLLVKNNTYLILNVRKLQQQKMHLQNFDVNLHDKLLKNIFVKF